MSISKEGLYYRGLPMTETPDKRSTPEEVAAKLIHSQQAEIQRLKNDLAGWQYTNRVNCQTMEAMKAEIAHYRAELTRLRDCDWVISLPDRMDAVRDIAKEALGEYREGDRPPYASR